MTGPETHGPEHHDGVDPGLAALYRAAAVETPRAETDMAVLNGAAAELRRRRYAPWMALVASLLLAVLLVPALSQRRAPPVDPAAVDQYLMQVQTPLAPAADPVEALLLEAPSPVVEAGL